MYLPVYSFYKNLFCSPWVLYLVDRVSAPPATCWPPDWRRVRFRGPRDPRYGWTARGRDSPSSGAAVKKRPQKFSSFSCALIADWNHARAAFFAFTLKKNWHFWMFQAILSTRSPRATQNYQAFSFFLPGTICELDFNGMLLALPPPEYTHPPQVCRARGCAAGPGWAASRWSGSLPAGTCGRSRTSRRYCQLCQTNNNVLHWVMLRTTQTLRHSCSYSLLLTKSTCHPSQLWPWLTKPVGGDTVLGWSLWSRRRYNSAVTITMLLVSRLKTNAPLSMW